MLILVFLPLVIAIVYALRLRKGLYAGTLACCIGIAAGMIMYALAVQAVTGTDLISFYRAGMDSYLEQNEMITLYGYSMLTGNADIAQVTFAEALPVMKSYMAEQLGYMVPAFAAGIATVGGLIVYLIARAIAKKSGAGVAKIPPFTEFFLPRHFGRYSVLIFLIVYIGYRMNWGGNAFALPFHILAAILGCVYFIQGLCFLDFLMKLRIKSTVARILILFVISLIFIYIFIILGLFDQAFKVRKRIIAARSEQS